MSFAMPNEPMRRFNDDHTAVTMPAISEANNLRKFEEKSEPRITTKPAQDLSRVPPESLSYSRRLGAVDEARGRWWGARLNLSTGLGGDNKSC